MGFHRRAWNAAADQYGASRSEKWGRIAAIIMLSQILLGIVFFIGIMFAVGGYWG
jgi:hypothetical protein